MQIIENTLHIDSVQIPLPTLPQDSKVHVWRVPTAYRDSGYFASVQLPFKPQEIPACSIKDCDYLGELDYPADPVARLAAAKAAKLEQIKEACDKAVGMLTATYPQVEIQSWPQQVKEADAYAADPATPVPLLESIAAERGLTVAELVGRVHAKVQGYAVASGQLIGRRQSLEDAIDAAEDEEALHALQWGE